MYVANRPNIASGGSAMLIRKSIKHYDVGVCSTSSGRSKGFGAIDPTSRYTSEFVFRLFIVISNVDVYFHHYFFRLFGTEQMTIIMEQLVNGITRKKQQLQKMMQVTGSLDFYFEVNDNTYPAGM